MPKLIALLQFLLALGGCAMGSNTYTHRISNNGHDVLASQARQRDGMAHFDCEASDSGWCHYTLYADDCAVGEACAQAPLRHFAVARGDSRQIAGLGAVRVCVGLDAGALGPDCKPASGTR